MVYPITFKKSLIEFFRIRLHIRLHSRSLPRLVRRSPALHVAGPQCRSPCPAALRPLGLASLPHSPLTVLVVALPQGLRASSIPGARPTAFLQEGSGGRCSGWTLCASAGCWGTPADACCTARRVRPPFGPLAMGPPPPPPQFPQRARPDPPQARGLCLPPGAPLAFLREGSGGSARVGTLCATVAVGARRPMPS
jgi:hypothetical protein